MKYKMCNPVLVNFSRLFFWSQEPKNPLNVSIDHLWRKINKKMDGLNSSLDTFYEKLEQVNVCCQNNQLFQER